MIKCKLLSNATISGNFTVTSCSKYVVADIASVTRYVTSPTIAPNTRIKLTSTASAREIVVFDSGN